MESKMQRVCQVPFVRSVAETGRGHGQNVKIFRVVNVETDVPVVSNFYTL
jgi:hypothetical protein